MAVNNFDSISIARVPLEADSPLVINTDAVLSPPCTLECFEPVA
jgi:hypothetical protein